MSTLSRELRRTTVAGATKFLSTVGDRQVRVIASDGAPDRMGDILVPWGVVLDEFRRNPVVLAQHDNAAPIARCGSIGVEGAAVVATIDFPAAGISQRSDEYLALLKAGVLSAVSVGFLPLEAEPIKGAGWKYTRWELLELSVVSIPANPNALVTAKSFPAAASDHLVDPFSTLRYSGTFEQRKRQADRDRWDSPEEMDRARARARLRLLQLKYSVDH